MTETADTFDPRQQHPFAREGLWRRGRYFLLFIVLAWLLQPLSTVAGMELTVAAFALTVAIIAAIVVAPWQRLPRWARALPPLAWIIVATLLRHEGGGAGSGYAALMLLPVLWFALYGSRRELATAIVAVVVAIAGPPLLIESPTYPITELRRAALVTAFGTFIGVAVQGILLELRNEVERRRRAEQALRDLEALEINDDVVQGLVVAKMALQLGRTDLALQSVDESLEAGKRIISRLAASSQRFRRDR